MSAAWEVLSAAFRESYNIRLFELTAGNAADYLLRRGFEKPCAPVTELGGGVSNMVLFAETADRRIVLKQSLGRLRVDEEWLSDRGRIARESAAMRLLAPCFPPGGIPVVLFEDPENFIYAMDAAPANAETWKALLFAGERRMETAERAGKLLATLVSATWMGAEWESRFGDQTVFRQLRIDPYYRTTAARHPDLKPHFDRMIEESRQRRVSLVHGDWSPKNLLVAGDLVTIIDFEVIHYGDPAFDAAFLLNHLLLKAVYFGDRAIFASLASQFWRTFTAGLPSGSEWMESATIRHLGCLLLARVDGKSPAEYVKSDILKERVRRKARELILNPPTKIAEVFAC